MSIFLFCYISVAQDCLSKVLLLAEGGNEVPDAGKSFHLGNLILVPHVILPNHCEWFVAVNDFE
jgi:hypothetical protein